MARPERNNVDYFPFLCKEGEAMQFIEQRYGNDGYATWVKILRELSVKNYHHLDLSNNRRLMSLASKCRISEDTLINIINDLCEFGEFDRDLWDIKILWNQKLIDSIQDAYKKRLNECITYEGVMKMIAGGEPEKKEPKKVMPAVPSPKAAKATEVVHEYFKTSKDLEMWFRDLENGSHIIDMQKTTGLPLEVLKANIPGFKKKADVAESYTNYFKFVTHFKNWVQKPENRITATGPTKITKLQ